MSCSHVIEGMKGCRKGGGKRRGSGGRRGGYIGARRYRTRNNWRRGEYTTIYDGIPYYWGGWHTIAPPNVYNYYPSWFYTPRCRTGCGYLGNGVVGCINPTNTPNSCIFASDCYGC